MTIYESKKEKNYFKTFSILSLSLFLLCLYGYNLVWAQEKGYPSKTIKILVPFAVGGMGDPENRMLTDYLSRELGVPIIVENKIGGSGVIGINAVAKAPPDGYTIGTMTYSANVIIPHLRSVPYDTKEDFTYIMQYADYMYALCVLADTPWKTFKEFIEDARKNPGKLTYTTPGPLTIGHIYMESVALENNVKLTHLPVQGDAELVSKFLGRHIDASFATVLIPQIPEGKIRGLAVAGKKRYEVIPNVPTFSELGCKWYFSSYAAICAPAGVDPRIVKKLNDAFKKAYDDPSFKQLLGTLGMIPEYKDPESFKEMVMKDIDHYGKILKELGFVK